MEGGWRKRRLHEERGYKGRKEKVVETLYTRGCYHCLVLLSPAGERRIRVHTLALPVSNQLSQIYARLNIQAIAGVLANMGKNITLL